MTYEEAKKLFDDNYDKVINHPFDNSTVGFIVIATLYTRGIILSQILGGQTNQAALIQEGLIDSNELDIYVFSNRIRQSVNDAKIMSLDKFLNLI